MILSEHIHDFYRVKMVNNGGCNMQPITTPETTNILKAPPNMDGGLDLPVEIGYTEDGTPYFRSVWQLSPEEIAEIQRTGRINLYVFTRMHPPVGISVAIFNEEAHDAYQRVSYQTDGEHA
jgi:hypothetical protein